jgi:hypothetical protein
MKTALHLGNLAQRHSYQGSNPWPLLGFVCRNLGYLQSKASPISMNIKRFDSARHFLLLLVAMMLAIPTQAQKEPESIDKYRVVYDYKAPAFEGGKDVIKEEVATRPKNPGEFGVFYQIDPVLGRMIELHRTINYNTTEGPGFRIQIYAGSKMEMANEAKADFLQSFSQDDIPVYQNWQPPHFRVRVGDYLSRQEAMRQIAHIRQIFPDAFVVTDKINLPKYKKPIAREDIEGANPNQSPE